eukprot:gnl/TRDRNA2_/TRDRNA2_153416_c1_seq2.p1 gnl/TRDRNA2_/TRDRNA2_153416_c1~~gnl/TRDRNA2_/TRDRNA2_153416_c1_seq2.p1  ORF type:complete len:153 (+),score=27.08 gnl/TRDRNA2_/TRDRNA2_153416_c1_seq2:44-460(+)
MNDDDSEGSADVSWEELQKYLANEHVSAYMAANDLDVSDAAAIFHLIDVDKSGTVTIEEFCLGCLRLRGPAKCLDVVHMLQESTDVTKIVQHGLDDLRLDIDRLLQVATGSGSESRARDAAKRMDAAGGYMNRIGLKN